ncbi:MAG: hypothetical protein RL328_1656, partial [Acidobacteriota bacterium]
MDSIGETRRECLEELDQYVTKYGQPIEDGGVVIPAKYVLGY